MNKNYKDYKIVICAAHSQGKTTLVNALAQNPLLTHDLKFSFRTNLTRDLSKILPINESGDDVSQYLIMARHLEFSLTPGRWIMDRGALDGIAYSHYFYEEGKVDPVIMDALKKIYVNCLTRYNKIFYIAPELPLVDDGQRSINQPFFDGVVKQFDFYTRHHSVSSEIIYLTGSIEERANRVIEEVKKDFKNEL